MKWILKNWKFKCHGYTDTTRNFRLDYKSESHLVALVLFSSTNFQPITSYCIDWIFSLRNILRRDTLYQITQWNGVPWWLKDLVLSLLWRRFNPWSRNFCMLWAWPKKRWLRYFAFPHWVESFFNWPHPGIWKFLGWDQTGTSAVTWAAAVRFLIYFTTAGTPRLNLSRVGRISASTDGRVNSQSGLVTKNGLEA